MREIAEHLKKKGFITDILSCGESKVCSSPSPLLPMPHLLDPPFTHIHTHTHAHALSSSLSSPSFCLLWRQCAAVCRLEKDPDGAPGKHRRLDLRLMYADQYPFGLLYFTGSDETNKEMRRRAIELDMQLNEYCIRLGGGFDGARRGKIRVH